MYINKYATTLSTTTATSKLKLKGNTVLIQM